MSQYALSSHERAIEASLHHQMQAEDERRQRRDGQDDYEDDAGGAGAGAGLDDSQYDQMGGDPHDYDDGGMAAGNAEAMSNGLLQLSLDTATGSSSSGGPSAGTRDSTDLASAYPVFRQGEAISGARGVISAIKCDRTNGHVYLAAYTGELILFDFHSHREVWRRRVELDGRPVQLTCVDIRHTKLALGGAQGETLIYDLEAFRVAQAWTDHTQRVSAIAWAGDAGLIYTTSHDGYFLVRDADKKGKIVHSFITCTCPLSAMQVESPNVVYLGSWDGQVKKLDLEKKQVVLVMKANLTKESPIRCFALAPSPVPKKKKKGATEEAPVFILVIAHGIGEIKSWDMRTGKVHVDSYQGCTDVVNAMTVWNGKLYAAGDDRQVRMFDLNSGVCIESLSGHENGVTCLEVCGVTPIVTQEMLDAQAELESSRRGKKERAASAPKQQQGVGNEILLTGGFDGQGRSYKIAAIDAAIQLKLLKLEEQKAQSFEAFCATKAKPKKKGASGSRKGSAKGKAAAGSGKKKKAGSAKKSSDSAKKATGSAKGTARSSGTESAAGSKGASKPATARSGTSAAATSAVSATPKKKKGSAKKAAAAK